MTLSAEIKAYVDDTIKKSGAVVTASGTVVSSPSYRQGDPLQVTLDGSATAVPVKAYRGFSLLPGMRVGLVKTGSDWSVIGAFVDPTADTSSQLLVEPNPPAFTIKDPPSNSYVQLKSSAGQPQVWLKGADHAGHTISPSVLFSGDFGSPNFGPFTQLASPRIDGSGDAHINLVGENAGGLPSIDLRRTGGSGGTVQILDGLDLSIGGVVKGGQPVGYLPNAVNVNQNTTFGDVTGLSFTGVAGAWYFVDLQMSYTTPSAAGFKVQWTGPSGVNFTAMMFLGRIPAGPTVSFGNCGAGGSVTGLNGGTDAFKTWGLVVMGTAGTVQVQAAQNGPNTAGTTQVNAGSFVRARRYL